MLKGPTKSEKRHYAPRAGPACRHWLKQLPGHLTSCKMIEILEKQAAGSHAGDAVLIGTTGPSHREAWIRLSITQLWWDFVEKILQPANLQNFLSLLSPTIAILQSTITLKAHDKAAISRNQISCAISSCHLQSKKHSWILLNGSKDDLVSSSASFSSNPLSSNSRSSKSSCVGTSTCASLKKFPKIDFQLGFVLLIPSTKENTWVQLSMLIWESAGW